MHEEVSLDALRDRVQQDVEKQGRVGHPYDPARLVHTEGQELAQLLAQGGMPRLFWAGIETWVNERLRLRSAGYTVHLVR